MRLRYLATVLIALAILVLGAAVLAMANYHDDGPEQRWQFELGAAIVRFGLPVLIAGAIVAVISTLRNDR